MGSNLGDDYIRSFSFVELIEKRRLLRDCYEIELECFRDCRTAGNDNNATKQRSYSNQPSSRGIAIYHYCKHILMR